MFAASGPIIGWFVYRQPIGLAAIRATLLGFFALSTAIRTMVVAAGGGLTTEVLGLTAAALPLVVLGVAIARRFPPRISEKAFKQAVAVLLVAIGAWIAVYAVWTASATH